MMKWILIILGFQLAGELSANVLKVPVPGPVIGMVLMFLLLFKMGRVPDDLRRLADSLLRHLYLYFIPASVGITAHIALVASQLVPILTAVIVSSALAMIVSGLLMQGLAKQENDDAV